jgi:hypothetical protein
VSEPTPFEEMQSLGRVLALAENGKLQLSDDATQEIRENYLKHVLGSVERHVKELGPTAEAAYYEWLETPEEALSKALGETSQQDIPKWLLELPAHMELLLIRKSMPWADPRGMPQAVFCGWLNLRPTSYSKLEGSAPGSESEKGLLKSALIEARELRSRDDVSELCAYFREKWHAADKDDRSTKINHLVTSVMQSILEDGQDPPWAEVSEEEVEEEQEEQTARAGLSIASKPKTAREETDRRINSMKGSRERSFERPNR